jgi:hypothetical protein
MQTIRFRTRGFLPAFFLAAPFLYAAGSWLPFSRAVGATPTVVFFGDVEFMPEWSS